MVKAEVGIKDKGGQFKYNLDQVRELVSKMSVEVDENKHLCADQYVGGELDIFFSCMFCLQVVEDPKECL